MVFLEEVITRFNSRPLGTAIIFAPTANDIISFAGSSNIVKAESIHSFINSEEIVTEKIPGYALVRKVGNYFSVNELMLDMYKEGRLLYICHSTNNPEDIQLDLVLRAMVDLIIFTETDGAKVSVHLIREKKD